MRMLLEKNRALAGGSLLSALSVLLLLMGSYLYANTLFLTVLAAYLIGYSVHRYGLKYGGMQWIVCTILDLCFNSDKMNGFLYLILGGYIYVSEWTFRKWNREQEIRRKIKIQLLWNWILFNVLYVPAVIGFRHVVLHEKVWEVLPGKAVAEIGILIAAGQVGWFVYDRAYRVFFGLLRKRKL